MRQTQNAQKKDNRKSIFVIGLLLLLVAVIGFGGYTLSKYVTEKKETGHASVAKWGFTVETKTADLFGANYKFDNTKNSSVVTTDDTAAALTVKASDTENRVAPGTSGSMTFTIKGSAEVKAKVEINMTVNKDVVLKYTVGATAAQEYKPVKWTLKKDNAVVNDKDGAALQDVTLAKIAAELNTYGATVDANGTYAHAGSYTIEWAWDFDASGAGTNDALDTLLGWKASNTVVPEGYGYAIVDEGTQTTIEFALNISITQEQK